MATCVPEPDCATAAPARGRPRSAFGPDSGADPGPEGDPPAGNAVTPRPRRPRGPSGGISRKALASNDLRDRRPRRRGVWVPVYGYRFHDPLTGRWPSRDPIEERGGSNLYAIARNRGPGVIDSLGTVEIEVHTDILAGQDLVDEVMGRLDGLGLTEEIPPPLYEQLSSYVGEVEADQHFIVEPVGRCCRARINDPVLLVRRLRVSAPQGGTAAGIPTRNDPNHVTAVPIPQQVAEGILEHEMGHVRHRVAEAKLLYEPVETFINGYSSEPFHKAGSAENALKNDIRREFDDMNRVRIQIELIKRGIHRASVRRDADQWVLLSGAVDWEQPLLRNLEAAELDFSITEGDCE